MSHASLALRDFGVEQSKAQSCLRCICCIRCIHCSFSRCHTKEFHSHALVS